ERRDAGADDLAGTRLDPAHGQPVPVGAAPVPLPAVHPRAARPRRPRLARGDQHRPAQLRGAQRSRLRGRAGTPGPVPRPGRAVPRAVRPGRRERRATRGGVLRAAAGGVGLAGGGLPRRGTVRFRRVRPGRRDGLRSGRGRAGVPDRRDVDRRRVVDPVHRRAAVLGAEPAEGRGHEDRRPRAGDVRPRCGGPARLVAHGLDPGIAGRCRPGPSGRLLARSPGRAGALGAADRPHRPARLRPGQPDPQHRRRARGRVRLLRDRRDGAARVRADAGPLAPVDQRRRARPARRHPGLRLHRAGGAVRRGAVLPRHQPARRAGRHRVRDGDRRRRGPAVHPPRPAL
ncbi:MAG: hypothetical protein AVDCRST_MAG57-2369, partial [uncultured Blastococcus sp.]